MVFSSITFIFAFLPCVIIGYYCIFNRNRSWQNYFLLICSLLFYAWGGIQYLILMLFSILFNWGMGLCIEKSQYGYKKLLLVVDIVCNVFALFVFKYLMFTVENINQLFHVRINCPDIALPIGISFFTFQAMSYVIDVYKGEKALKNLLDLGLYISFFPQLVAGPIVRYDTIKEQIHHRVETYEGICLGVEKFIIGLGKKCLIANSLACVSESVFSMNGMHFSVAWIGAIAYTFQIYFDFSGYSDMAIGLGHIFGFVFPENFNYPYISRSITEFWRRWHISMGTWFRDYVYFPLGGSRGVSKRRQLVNLFVVWLCTGIWHGANWTFILWSLLHFAILVIEKNVRRTDAAESWIVQAWKRMYTMLVVIFGWVLFNSASVGDALTYIKSMLDLTGQSAAGGWQLSVSYLSQYGIAFIGAILFAFPVYPWTNQLLGKKLGEKASSFIRGIAIAMIFILSVVFIAKGTYNPFIYFNF